MQLFFFPFFSLNECRLRKCFASVCVLLLQKLWAFSKMGESSRESSFLRNGRGGVVLFLFFCFWFHHLCRCIKSHKGPCFQSLYFITYRNDLILSCLASPFVVLGVHGCHSSTAFSQVPGIIRLFHVIPAVLLLTRV